ncbi:hypothetical protein CMALT394_620018 [Carnobacterium maltaromaticum]|nr:hypothetical protein CMALT394_620018 [Carnobacterium maltaromaticum]
MFRKLNEKPTVNVRGECSHERFYSIIILLSFELQNIVLPSGITL